MLRVIMADKICRLRTSYSVTAGRQGKKWVEEKVVAAFFCRVRHREVLTSLGLLGGQGDAVFVDDDFLLFVKQSGDLFEGLFAHVEFFFDAFCGAFIAEH